MRIAKDGIGNIAFLLLVGIAFAFVNVIPALIIFALAALVIWFFRDPDRTANYQDGEFYSPADGKVVEISEANHEFTGECVKIGIFMNIFSVHVNRAPCSGEVAYLEYVPGKKLAAFAPKASEINERNILGFAGKSGRVLVVQIAGLVARRIVCRVRRGDNLRVGERFGMIKLGSRLDVYLPRDTILKVKIGEKVFAGKTCLGVRN